MQTGDLLLTVVSPSCRGVVGTVVSGWRLNRCTGCSGLGLEGQEILLWPVWWSAGRGRPTAASRTSCEPFHNPGSHLGLRSSDYLEDRMDVGMHRKEHLKTHFSMTLNTPPHTAQTSNCLIRPICCLSSDPFGTKVALNTPLRCSASSTAACTFCAYASCNKPMALVFKDAGLEVYARNSLYFQSKRNVTISDKNSCILNTQRGITKRTQMNSSWMDIITAGVMSVLQSMKTRNDVTECGENQSAHSILPLPQSENPMAQTSDRPPPQTSHTQSDPTTSAQLRKLPTQLNTPNMFVPDLVRVSPNASDVQRLSLQSLIVSFYKLYSGVEMIWSLHLDLT